MDASTALNDLQERARSLADLALSLRESHIGLEATIDRLLDAVRPWYLFAEAQQRPRVIGLWGMTGTGKSSLVRELVAQLGLEERCFQLDAGEHRRHHWLDDTLERARETHDGRPFVLVVDEFQHARTMKQGMEQDEAPELRRLWELIDSGRAWESSGFRHGLSTLLDLQSQLKSLLKENVHIRKGRVVRGVPAYRRIMSEHLEQEEGTERWGIPRSLWDRLRDMERTPRSLTAFQESMEQLDGNGLLHFVEDMIRQDRAPRPVDCSKALVIVLGNLDELYMSGKEPWPELDPDVLLHRHVDLDASGIQQALLGLFRLEQVARLGTDQVVFPPMGRGTVVQLVQREAEALAARLYEQSGIRIEMRTALLERLVREAAIAVFGARPVLDAVHRVIPALFAQTVVRHGAGVAERCVLDVRGEQVVAHLHAGGHVRVVRLEWPLRVSSTPGAGAEDMQRYAVHEAGHLLCGILNAGQHALQACIRSRHGEARGFVIWDREVREFTLKDAVPRLSVLLGGWAAERLVYGTDGVSTGSRSDLQAAAQMALQLVREHGMGGDRLFRTHHATANGPGFRILHMEAEQQAREWMEAAEQLAQATLERERALLDAIVEALVEQGSLNAEAIGALVAAHFTDDRSRPDPRLVVQNAS